MVIFPLGLSSFKLQIGNVTVLLDPHDGTQGIRAPRSQADLTLVAKSDGRNPAAGGANSFVIDRPGEYEIKGVSVYGIPANDASQTFFVVEAEGLRLGHLGDLNRILQNGEMEHLDSADILFLPVGGHGVLDAVKAQEVISELEPRVVIPMHFKMPGLKTNRDTVATFCKEMGVKDTASLDKLRIAPKDLPQEETRVIVLQP